MRFYNFLISSQDIIFICVAKQPVDTLRYKLNSTLYMFCTFALHGGK
jgi:hypothetical protein